MQKIIYITILFWILPFTGFSQDKLVLDLSFHSVKMLYDKAAPDNSQFFWTNKYLPMGIGAEISTYYQNNSGFSPQLDVSLTGFNYNYYSHENDSWKKSSTLNVFLGPSYRFANNISLAYTIGVSIMKS